MAAIEDRIGEEHAWGWAAQITSAGRRASSGTAPSEQGSRSPTILAAILATQAAARVHTGPDSDPTELWREVERGAQDHPDHELGSVLRLRAQLGRLATGDLAEHRSDRARPCSASARPRPRPRPRAASRVSSISYLELLRSGMSTIASKARSTTGSIWAGHDVLLGAIIAAVYGCVTRDQEVPGGTLLLDGLATAAGVSSVGAAALLAKAVHQLWAGSFDDAASAIDRAIEVADQAAAGPDSSWADWAAPRRLADRCRLIRVIIAWRRGEAVDSVPWQAWRTDALRRLDDVDCEYLVAATIRFELGHRLIAPEDLERIGRP